MKKITFFLSCMLLTLGVTNAWAAYEKATSIAVGDVVVLVNEDESKELNGFSTTKTVYGLGEAYTTAPAGLYKLTVEEGASAGTVAFKNGSTYLNWSSGNSLTASDTKTENSSWTVTFEEGNAIILNVADNARKLQWNASSPRFACYTSVQTAVQLYKEVESTGGEEPETPVEPEEPETPVEPEPDPETPGEGGDFSTTNTSNVTFTLGNSAYEQQVIISDVTYDVVKLGTSSKVGNTTFTIPANTVKIHMHIAGWNGKESALILSTTNPAVTITPAEITATSDAGIAKNSPYTLAEVDKVATDYFHTVELTGVTTETTITATTVSGKCRVVIWGVNTEVSISEEATTYTITTAVNDETMGTVTGGGKVVEGSTATLTAKANPGYEFVEWSNGSKENPLKVTVTEDITLTATFQAQTPITIAEALVLENGAACVLNPFTVVYVNGGNIYVEDESAYALAYKYNYGLKAGDKVTGLAVTKSTYNDIAQLVPASAYEDLTVVAGEAPAIVELTTAPTVADNHLVKLMNVKMEGEFTTTASVTLVATCEDGTTINIYNNKLNEYTFVAEKTYSITGGVTQYKNVIQIQAYEIEEYATIIACEVEKTYGSYNDVLVLEGETEDGLAVYLEVQEYSAITGNTCQVEGRIGGGWRNNLVPTEISFTKTADTWTFAGELALNDGSAIYNLTATTAAPKSHTINNSRNAVWAGNAEMGWKIKLTQAEYGEVSIDFLYYPGNMWQPEGWSAGLAYGDTWVEATPIANAPTFDTINDIVSITLEAELQAANLDVYSINVTATPAPPVAVEANATMALSEDEWEVGTMVVSATWNEAALTVKLNGWTYYGYGDYKDASVLMVGEDYVDAYGAVSIVKTDATAKLTGNIYHAESGTTYALNLTIADAPADAVPDTVYVNSANMEVSITTEEDVIDWDEDYNPIMGDVTTAELVGTCDLGAVSVILYVTNAGHTEANPYGDYKVVEMESAMGDTFMSPTFEITIESDEGSMWFEPTEDVVATFTKDEKQDTFAVTLVGSDWKVYAFDLKTAPASDPEVPSALDNVTTTIAPVKAIVNGQLVILKDGVQYNAQGAVIK